LTGDVSMIQRTFERYGPKKPNPKKPGEMIPDYHAKLPGKSADKIAADPRYKNCFEVSIPDGLGTGGTKTIIIVPMRSSMTAMTMFKASFACPVCGRDGLVFVESRLGDRGKTYVVGRQRRRRHRAARLRGDVLSRPQARA
jgi:hypothetical protein